MAEGLLSAYRNRNRSVPVAGTGGDESGYTPVRPASWNPKPGPVEIRAGDFAAASGCTIAAVYEAILLGLVPGGSVVRQVHRRVEPIWVVHVDAPDDTLQVYMRRLHARWPGLKSIGEMRWYERCRVVSGERAPHPHEWVKDYVALPFSHDGDRAKSELRSVVAGLKPKLTEIARRLDLERHGVVGEKPPVPVTGDVRKLLRAALTDNVPELVGTCLEDVVGASRTIPSSAMAGRLLDMDGRDRDVAIADTCDTVENAFIVRDCSVPLAHWRMAKVLKGIGRGDLRGVRRRIEAYLKGRILPQVPRRARRSDVFTWMACERRMRQWAAEPVGAVLQEWLLANKPDVPRDRGFVTMMIKEEEQMAGEGLARRKLRSDVIAESYDEWLATAEAMHDSSALAKKEFALAHKLAEGLPTYHHSYVAPMLSPEGRDTGKLMLVNVRSVTVAWLVATLTEAAISAGIKLPNVLADLGPGGKSHNDALSASRLILYDDVERMGGGCTPEDPEWARAFVSGALLLPADMTNELVERRRRFYCQTALPSYTGAFSGLLRSDDPHVRELMKWALTLTDDVVVTIAEYHRGISMGRALYRIAAMTRARITTVLQTADDERRWGVLPTRHGDQAAIRSIPKLPHEERLLDRAQKERLYGIDQDTADVIGDLIILTIAEDGGDPDDPDRLVVVKPGKGFPKDCGPDRYVFQIRGMILTVSDAVFCLSFLFGRLVLPHDIRHAGAAKGFEGGEAVEVVGETLDQRRRSRTLEYIRRGDGRMVGEAARTLELRDEVAQLGRRRPPAGLKGVPRR